MCGIVGYIGERPAAPLLLDALKRLEYRGYDSAGIATISNGLHVKKDKGKIDEIHGKLNLADMPGTAGIGHTRWATHGVPSQANAHPHLDEARRVAVVHNGIIENYVELRKFLIKKGYKFRSETDTEVVPNLIDYFIKKGKKFEEAVRMATKRLKGSYALAIAFTEEPDKIIAVRKESPLILGLGKDETFLASDIPAILPHTKRIIILGDGEMAILSPRKAIVKRLDSGKLVKKTPMEVAWTIEMAEKRGYPHFMLKEIHEQPDAVRETLRAPAEELDKLGRTLLGAKRVYLVACGTAYHAALVGKYALAQLADVSAEVVISSEFQESCMVDDGTVLLAISQSGETADTLKAVRVAKAKGARIACLTNVVGSSITRESEVVCYTHAGPEIGVAATKTFSAQVAYLLRLSLFLAKKLRRISRAEFEKLTTRLREIPKIVEKVLEKVEPLIRSVAKRYKDAPNFYFIGRGIGYPIVMEGALKLKEIAYIHSEATPAGELKHGPLALIEEGVPVVAAVVPGASHSRMMGNVEETKARGGTIIALAPEDDLDIEKHVNELIRMPKTHELFTPLTYIIPLQLLAYYISVERGFDPDKPRHLAKSVTVE
jgi:glucosamine--fructose-6-phosphate aminotransferase (isomerizing)